MTTFNFNLNHNVFVKLTDKGIIHYVKTFNRNLVTAYSELGMSTKAKDFLLTEKEFIAKQNDLGYFKLQGHEFLEYLGGIPAVSVTEYYDLNLKFEM